MEENKFNINRRQFIVQSGFSIAALGAIGVGANYLKNLNTENAKTLLRPPGAVSEEEFIYACIKCGLCVQICPIEAVKLAGIDEGLSIGTPYIDPRKQACDFSCDAMQCVETCPTAALDFLPFKKQGENTIIEQEKLGNTKDPNFNPFVVQSKAMKAHTKMGIAVVNEKTCLAHQGKGIKGQAREEGFTGVYRSPNLKLNEKRATLVNEHTFNSEICDLCITECPIGETAIISVENTQGLKIPKVLEACTGCGVCTMLCPTDPVSITIEKLIS